MKKLAVFLSGMLLSMSAFSADLPKREVANLIAKAVKGDLEAQGDLADYYQSYKHYTQEFYWTKN